MQAQDSMDKLIRQLNISTKVIDRLIEIGARPIIIERKLTELQNLIAEIPSSRTDLTERWDTTIAALWANFALNCIEKDCEQNFRSSSTSLSSTICGQFDHSNASGDIANISGTKSNRNSDNVRKKQQPAFLRTFSRSTVSTCDAMQQNVDRNSTSPSQWSSNFSNKSSKQIANNKKSELRQIANCKINYTKQECFTRMAEAFAKLDPCRDRDDLPQLKQLLVLAVKCRTLCQPFCPDQLPFCEVYDCTWARLPADLQQIFIDETNHSRFRKTISCLISFLMRYLRDVGQKRATEIVHANLYCSFCRMKGHTSNGCTVLRDYIICFICAEFGHSQQRCPMNKRITEDFYNDLICSL